MSSLSFLSCSATATTATQTKPKSSLKKANNTQTAPKMARIQQYPDPAQDPTEDQDAFLLMAPRKKPTSSRLGLTRPTVVWVYTDQERAFLQQVRLVRASTQASRLHQKEYRAQQERKEDARLAIASQPQNKNIRDNYDLARGTLHEMKNKQTHLHAIRLSDVGHLEQMYKTMDTATQAKLADNYKQAVGGLDMSVVMLQLDSDSNSDE